jgi:hypothetical protein
VKQIYLFLMFALCLLGCDNPTPTPTPETTVNQEWVALLSHEVSLSLLATQQQIEMVIPDREIGRAPSTLDIPTGTLEKLQGCSGNNCILPKVRIRRVR